MNTILMMIKLMKNNDDNKQNNELINITFPKRFKFIFNKVEKDDK